MHWDKRYLDSKLLQDGIEGRYWGSCGEEAAKTIESAIGYELNDEIRSFALSIGNIQIGPIDTMVTGKQGVNFNAATETGKLPLTQAQREHWLKVSDHAGESIIYSIRDESVSVYDSFDLQNPTMRFESLELYFDWVISFSKGLSTR